MINKQVHALNYFVLCYEGAVASTDSFKHGTKRRVVVTNIQDSTM